LFEKYNPEVGSRPGTLAIPPNSPFPNITVVEYDVSSVRRREIENVQELRSLERGEGVTWVDVQGLGDEATIRAIGDIFELHPVALENAVNVPQRAKTELYTHHQLVIARTPRIDEEGVVRTPQVCFVIGERYLLTFQERYFGFFDAVRERIEAGLGPIRSEGPGYLAYAMIDAMVDRYYPIAQRLSDQLGELDEVIVEHPHPEVLNRVHQMRRQLVVLRRIGWPQREALRALAIEPSPFVREQTLVFLRHAEAHMTQIMEAVDSARETTTGLVEIYLSNIGQRTNEIMKVLTLMASIFIPLTFIAGIYGMNFENMPELHQQMGYPSVLGLMAVTAVGMLAYFRRKGWLGGRGRGRRDDG
jgi:magnesium transporter